MFSYFKNSRLSHVSLQNKVKTCSLKEDTSASCLTVLAPQVQHVWELSVRAAARPREKSATFRGFKDYVVLAAVTCENSCFVVA